MQIFEQYSVSQGACQFALAALEQVDVVINLSDGNNDDDLHPEPATIIWGRLWANVFKFTLDMKQYGDAYCAIISNPDEDSKYICLRHFVIVLCELGEAKKVASKIAGIVAETLLYTDPQIELPLWLVHMFKVAKFGSCRLLTNNIN